jgi:hypothetical protein
MTIRYIKAGASDSKDIEQFARLLSRPRCASIADGFLVLVRDDSNGDAGGLYILPVLWRFGFATRLQPCCLHGVILTPGNAI